MNPLEALQEISKRAFDIARSSSQTVGAKGDYYITLEQLDRILIALEPKA
jgi:hypothetical protein